MSIFTWLRRNIAVPLALIFTLPALCVRILGIEVSPVWGIATFGMAIVAAAFILLWAGEAAQVDVAGGLAIAALAVIAVLPEYAVDLYFAFVAGTEPEYAHFAAANMTGSNRLLLGLGWPAVVLAAFLAYRFAREHQRQDDSIQLKPFAIQLDSGAKIDIGVLLIASVLVMIVPLTGQIHLGLSAVLFVLFSWYLYRMSQSPVVEPDLSGTSARIAGLPKIRRRVTVITMFIVAATVILLSAEPFAHSLVEGGRVLGIDDFLLVQWLAPLASESPEFLLAFILAFSGRSGMAIGILIASKVNQWTLLVGSLPIAYLVGGGGLALPMDARQVEEFVLTMAQTLLGIGMLLALRFSWRSATSLFVLFSATFIFTTQDARWIIAGCYLLIALFLFARKPRQLSEMLRAPFRRLDSDTAAI
ncbi:MAG: sodium:proton exchanger [Microbacteriaceae bacterium]